MYPTVYWGDLLRGLREKHHMLQKEVAILLHTSRQSYSNLENGRTQPSPEQLAALSYIYDVNLLDYVQKCLPPGFVAEQSAYRTIQTRRVEEVRLEEEAKKKAASLRATRKKNNSSENSVNSPDEEEEPSEGNVPEEKTFLEPASQKEKKDIKKPGSTDQNEWDEAASWSGKGKRETPVRYHNTSGMSSVDLLFSGKKPRVSDIDAEAFLGTSDLLAPKEPPKKKGRPPKKNPDQQPAEAKNAPDAAPFKAVDSAAEKCPSPPSPEELMAELFPRETPYPRKPELGI